MPGARAISQKKLTRAEQKAPMPTIAKPAVHGGKRALLEGRAALLLKLIKRKESAENFLRLAEIYIALEQESRAKDALDQCLKLDASDLLRARRVLAPLLLNLGDHEGAENLLNAKWASDTSAVMLCSRLLLVLATWDGEDATHAAACAAAYDAAHAANWHATLLLAATSSGDSPIPENAISDLREQRLEALKKFKPGDAEWPGAGGVQEAMLLSEQFAGFAGCAEEQHEAWPGLEGAEVWLARRFLETAAEAEPPTKSNPCASDEKKHVRLFDEKLEEILEEVQHILLDAEEGEGEEEEGEGEQEEGRAGPTLT